MHFVHYFLFVAACCVCLPVTAPAQVIDIGEATRLGEGRLAVAVESSDAKLAQLARRACALHGGFQLAAAAQSSYVFNFELRRSVAGRDWQHALLRACDMAVEATLHSKGFFAGKLAFIGKQGGVSEVYTSDLLFNQVRPLTADRALVTGLSWSPDGSKLLYTTYYKSGFPDIYMLNLSSARKQPIATFKGTNSGGAFSPNGASIAMSLSGPGNAEIFVADANGRNPRRLTTNQSLETSPSWSPDGRRLVFTSDVRGKPQLYQVSANGGPMRRVPTNVSSYCSEPAWNPVKENLIAFTAAVRGGFQIALYDSSSRSSRILTSGPASAVEPVWLNDGRHLIFTQRQQGRMRLMLLDTVSGKTSALHVTSFGDASSASFVYPAGR